MVENTGFSLERDGYNIVVAGKLRIEYYQDYDNDGSIRLSGSSIFGSSGSIFDFFDYDKVFKSEREVVDYIKSVLKIELRLALLELGG